MYRENALPKSTRLVTYNGTRPSVYVAVLLQLLLAAITATATYARIRSQPPERIVRVSVPGPERVVSAPPGRCQDSASAMQVAFGVPTQTCPPGATVRVVPATDNYVVLECHCPVTP